MLITPSDKGYSQPHGVSAADFLFPTTPESAPVTPSSTPGGNAFENRLNSGVSVATLNVHLGDRGDFEPSEAKPIGQCCRVNAAGLPQIGNVNASDDFPNVSERYRFMFTTLDERSRAIDKHLLSIQKDMCEGCFINELQPVGVPSPETVWICGRICNVAVEGKITKANIILEGSLSESGGRRVFLDVSELTEYSLFPGQVVCVQGINSGGRTMVAQRIIEGKALPLPTSKPESLLEMHYSRKYQGGKALKVRVTCGPYTTSDNLNFDPFMTLMAGVLADKPDVVIMLGPFVDINHPLLSSGQVYSDDRYGDTVEAEESFRKKTRTDEETADTYETLFRKRIGRDGFARFFNSEEDGERIETQFILIPSINDAFHECVFPQPPFGDRDEVQTSFFHEPLGRLDIPYSKESDGPLKRVHLLPNPCMFRINEVLFGTTSNDVLFSLSSDETSKIKENRLSRLSHHILQQQSFHPQFPNPPMANNTSIPVSIL